MITCKVCGGAGFQITESRVNPRSGGHETLSTSECWSCRGHGFTETDTTLATCTNAELVKRGGELRSYYPVLNEILTRLAENPTYQRLGADT